MNQFWNLKNKNLSLFLLKSDQKLTENEAYEKLKRSKKLKNWRSRSNSKEKSVRSYQKRKKWKKNNLKKKLTYDESNSWNGKKSWLVRFVLIFTINLFQWYLAYIIFVLDVFLDGLKSQKNVHNVERKQLKLWKTRRLQIQQLFIYKIIHLTNEIKTSRRNLINKICSQQTFMILKRNQRIELANSFSMRYFLRIKLYIFSFCLYNQLSSSILES